MKKPTTAATGIRSQISRATQPGYRSYYDHNQSFHRPTQSVYFANENFTVFHDMQEVHQRIDEGEIKIDNTTLLKVDHNLGDQQSRSKAELESEESVSRN